MALEVSDNHGLKRSLDDSDSPEAKRFNSEGSHYSII